MDGARGHRERRGQREHDGRVAEREEEPDPERATAFGDQLAGGVVDRRDVIGVERVPKPEAVGEDREPAEHRVAGGIERDQAPPDHVQAADSAAKGAQPPPLAGIQRADDARALPNRAKRSPPRQSSSAIRPSSTVTSRAQASPLTHSVYSPAGSPSNTAV